VKSELDPQSYVTRVADRLLIWSGAAVERPDFDGRIVDHTKRTSVRDANRGYVARPVSDCVARS
jgi:hypothetical protein